MFARVPAAGQDLTGIIKNLKHIGSKIFESPLATAGFHLSLRRDSPPSAACPEWPPHRLWHWSPIT